MIAIILAAGMGTRMGDLCQQKPKVMINFSGETLLSRQRKIFKNKEIKHYLVAGYQNTAIDFPSLLMIENKDFAITNMVYSLLCSRDIIDKHNNEDVIVSYGDIIYQENVIDSLIGENNGDIQVCADKNFLSLWSARMEDPLEDLENFQTDPVSGYISIIGGKSYNQNNISAQYIGLFKISAGFIDTFFNIYDSLLRQSDVYKKIAMTDYIQFLINKGAKVRPVYIQSGWLEFDTQKDFEKYNLMLENNKLSEFYVD